MCVLRASPPPAATLGRRARGPSSSGPFPLWSPCCEPSVQLPRGLRLRGRPPARIRCLRICLRPSGLRTAHGPSSGRQALRLRTWKWGGDVTGWAGTASGRLLTGLLHLAFQTIKLQHRVNQGHASVYSFTAQVLKLDLRTQSPASSEVGGVPLQVPGNRTGDLPRRDPVVSPSRSSRQRFQSPSSPQFPPSVPAARRWRAPRLTEEVPLLPAHPFGTGSRRHPCPCLSCPCPFRLGTHLGQSPGQGEGTEGALRSSPPHPPLLAPHISPRPEARAERALCLGQLPQGESAWSGLSGEAGSEHLQQRVGDGARTADRPPAPHVYLPGAELSPGPPGKELSACSVLRRPRGSVPVSGPGWGSS